jgi:hypothetical protein
MLTWSVIVEVSLSLAVREKVIRQASANADESQAIFLMHQLVLRR